MWYSIWGMAKALPCRMISSLIVRVLWYFQVFMQWLGDVINVIRPLIYDGLHELAQYQNSLNGILKCSFPIRANCGVEYGDIKFDFLSRDCM